MTQLAENQNINNQDKSFIEPGNFLESERESGYKNTVYALYELIDNSYEANASKIYITASRPGCSRICRLQNDLVANRKGNEVTPTTRL